MSVSAQLGDEHESRSDAEFLHELHILEMGRVRKSLVRLKAVSVSARLGTPRKLFF